LAADYRKSHEGIRRSCIATDEPDSGTDKLKPCAPEKRVHKRLVIDTAAEQVSGRQGRTLPENTF
jgi:hypothetical protein